MIKVEVTLTKREKDVLRLRAILSDLTRGTVTNDTKSLVQKHIDETGDRSPWTSAVINGNIVLSQKVASEALYFFATDYLNLIILKQEAQNGNKK